MTPLAPAVDACLRHDPRLPGRDHLLDDRRAAEVFAQSLGVDGPLAVDGVERVRVKYRIGESLRSVHRVWSGGRAWLVSARMRASGAAAIYTAAAAREQACLPLRGVSLHEGLQTVFWTFPNDRALGDAASLSPHLPAIRDGWPGVELALDIAGYNPERAVIARVSTVEGRTRGFAKLYAPDGLEPARRALDWLADAIDTTGAPLRVPRLVGCDRGRAVLVVDAVAGTHLERVTDRDLPRAFHDVGQAIGHLHALPLPAPATLPRHGTFDAAELARAAEAIAWARPDLAGLAARTVDLLARHRPVDDTVVGLHGDMNSKNWLVGPGDVGLIDFDQAAAGPAAVDLAGVFAWLHARSVCGDWPADREHALAAAFARGYAGVRALPQARTLRWHRGAALLVERALRAITRVRPGHLARLGDLVTAAHADAVEAA